MIERFRAMMRTLGLSVMLAGSSVTGHAASLSTTGGTTTSLVGIPGTFNPTWLDGVEPAGFNLSSMLRGGTLLVSGPSTVTYTLVGYEASYNNAFVSSAGRLDNRSGPTPLLGASFSFETMAGGALDFGFLSNGVGTLLGNGSAATGVILSNANPRSALVLFNDSFLGDRDFDDMVVRITVSAVPEPELAAMLTVGLGLVSLLARRSRRR